MAGQLADTLAMGMDVPAPSPAEMSGHVAVPVEKGVGAVR